MTRISGYAHVHADNPPDWIEVIPREVLERAVAERPTVPLRLGDRIIGEAHLSVDDVGLKVDTDLDLGWAFRVQRDEWSDDYRHRRIDQLSMEHVYLTPVGP